MEVSELNSEKSTFQFTSSILKMHHVSTAWEGRKILEMEPEWQLKILDELWLTQGSGFLSMKWKDWIKECQAANCLLCMEGCKNQLRKTEGSGTEMELQVSSVRDEARL